MTAPGPSNPLGWPGLWPVLQPFVSWDPAIAPSNSAATCQLTSDDNPGKHAALYSDDYECDYTTLNLPHRDAQVKKTIGPGSSGWTDWKEALWTLNYLQVMHNVKEAAVETVADSGMDQVGIPGNGVTGNILPGTYLGSSNVEGFQAGNFIQILDNQAAQWLLQLTTTDGAALGGFATLADALDYSPTSAARWFPASIGVTETADASGFPRPSGYAIASADSHLLDLAGLLGAYASVYALTDQSNTDVGGSQPAEVYFDGDPFPVQNQTPDGSPTLHDRALGDDPRRRREHGSLPSRCGERPLRRRRQAGERQARARDDAVGRRGGLHAALAAHGAARARLPAHALRQHQPRHAGDPVAARRLLEGRRRHASPRGSTRSSRRSPTSSTTS